MTTQTLTRPRATDAARQSGAGRPLGGRAASKPAAAKTQTPDRTSLRLAWWRGVRDADLVALCQHLAALYGSGITLAEGLRTFAAETPNKVFRSVINEIVADLETGRRLSEAFDRHPDQFSPYFRASVWAGETAGKMGETLERLARHLEKKQEMAQRVHSAFAYPIVLTVLIVGVVSFLVTYVVPVFAGVYERMGVDLPLVTTMLLGVSRFLSGNPWVPAVPVAAVLGGLMYVRRVRAARLAVDRWKVRIPVIGKLLKRITLHRFIRTFGEMMGAGVPVLESLNLAGKVSGNAAFNEALESVRADVRRGMGLTEPLRRTGWLPASLLQVIASGEQSGRVPALLERASDMLEREIDLTMKRTVSRLEPILTIVMAFLVGFILLAVYLPMFDVMRHVG